MTTTCQLHLPSDNSKDVINEIAKDEKLFDINISVDHGSSKGDNYLGEIFRIKISGVRESGSKDTINLILKMAPISPGLRQNVPVNLFYTREVYAYKKMLPVLNKLQEEYEIPKEERFGYAKLYKGINTDLGEMLIFEDLCAKGFVMYNRLKPYDYDHLSLCVKNLARYHATSFVLKAKDPELFDELASNTSKSYSDYGESFHHIMNNSAKKVLSIIDDPEEKQVLNRYFETMTDDFDRLMDVKTAAPYNVLCHGDCWSNNMLFSYENGKVTDMRMLDWQIIRCASPITDLAYLMFTSMDEYMRTMYYQQSLKLYYETLSTSISKMGFDIADLYPKHIYEDQIKSTMSFGFSMAILVLAFTLSDKDNPPDVEALAKKDSSEDNMVFSDNCIQRLKSIVKFCIHENII